MDTDSPALTDPRLDGVSYRVTRHPPVASLAEAAAARGVEESAIVKTMVVRISEEDYVFVLVPGDRVIDWAKLRDVLGVSRLSLPDAATAMEQTGYQRGAITPFGATHRWPVHADSRIAGQTVSVGAGARGMAITLAGDELIAALEATSSDLTKPAGQTLPYREEED